MRFPSKVTSYNESIFPAALVLAKTLQRGDMTVLALFRESYSSINNISDYFAALEILFALDKIQLSDRQGELHYVG